MFSGCEYIVGSTFEGIVQCVKSQGAFIDIGEDVGLLHISEISDFYGSVVCSQRKNKGEFFTN